MREADFGTVDGAIAGCFDEGEYFGVLRVADEPIDSILHSLLYQHRSSVS